MIWFALMLMIRAFRRATRPRVGARGTRNDTVIWSLVMGCLSWARRRRGSIRQSGVGPKDPGQSFTAYRAHVMGTSAAADSRSGERINCARFGDLERGRSFGCRYGSVRRDLRQVRRNVCSGKSFLKKLDHEADPPTIGV